MKRDMDVVREILLALETKEDDDFLELSLPEVSDESIVYHVKIMAQADLIDAMDLSTNDGPDWRATSLTWTGHEFLDNARNDTVWRKAKSIAAKAGSTSFGVLVHVLTSVIDAQLKSVGIT